MNTSAGRLAVLAVVVAAVAIVPREALAYVGPGGGLSALGTLLAVVVAVLAAILGFIWYPIKRFLQFLRSRRTPSADPVSTPAGDATPSP